MIGVFTTYYNNLQEILSKHFYSYKFMGYLKQSFIVILNDGLYDNMDCKDCLS
jgi:hypothetical protein